MLIHVKSIIFHAATEKKESMKLIMNSPKLRRPDSNERPLGYEPNELPLLHSAIFCGCKSTILI